MEQRYRGYPHPFFEWLDREEELLVEAQNAAPQPYMIYNREMQMPEDSFWDDRRRGWDEWNYFRGFYPLEAKRLQRVAEEEFDRIDQENGSMYDEYPDREYLYRVLDLMLARALAEGRAADRDLMQVVMLYELLRRRQERRGWR